MCPRRQSFPGTSKVSILPCRHAHRAEAVAAPRAIDRRGRLHSLRCRCVLGVLRRASRLGIQRQCEDRRYLFWRPAVPQMVQAASVLDSDTVAERRNESGRACRRSNTLRRVGWITDLVRGCNFADREASPLGKSGKIGYLAVFYGAVRQHLAGDRHSVFGYEHAAGRQVRASGARSRRCNGMPRDFLNPNCVISRAAWNAMAAPSRGDRRLRYLNGPSQIQRKRHRSSAATILNSIIACYATWHWSMC